MQEEWVVVCLVFLHTWLKTVQYLDNSKIWLQLSGWILIQAMFTVLFFAYLSSVVAISYLVSRVMAWVECIPSNSLLNIHKDSRQNDDFSEGTSTCLFTNISISHRQHSRGCERLTIEKSEGPGVWSFVIRLVRGMTPHSSISSKACAEPTKDVHATW